MSDTEYIQRLNSLTAAYHTISNEPNHELSDIEAALQAVKNVYSKLTDSKRAIVTIPSIFGKSYDENFISDFLAHLLDPVNSGLGYGPLNAVLNLIRYPNLLDNNSAHSVEIQREVSLSGDSRIDLLIIFSDVRLLLAIENKILANEGKRQTLRYADAIRESFPDFSHLQVYLTPTGAAATSTDFIPVSYGQLFSALKAIDLSASSERDRVIFQDFLDHVENYIMTSTNLKLSNKSLLYLSNFEMINDLEQSFSQDASNIFRSVTEIIRLTVGDNDEDWEFSFSENREWQYFHKRQWDRGQLFIHFEFWFSKVMLLTEPQLKFMVDVERKQKDAFLASFDKVQTSLKAQYQKSAIEYRPASRRNAIAFKTYDLGLKVESLDRTQLTTFFQKTIDEFLFLVDPIDQILKSKDLK